MWREWYQIQVEFLAPPSSPSSRARPFMASMQNAMRFASFVPGSAVHQMVLLRFMLREQLISLQHA